MSSVSVLAYFIKPKPPLSPIESSMNLESDRRVFGCMSAGSLLGLALVTYALTIQVVIHGDLYPPLGPLTENWPPKISFITPEGHRNLHPRSIKRQPIKTASTAHSPRSTHPVKVPGTLAQKLINSRSARTNLTAYDLIDKTLQQLDMDKLSQVAILTRSGPTRISGRPGKKNFEFNYSYYEDGNGEKDSEKFTVPHGTINRLSPTNHPSEALGRMQMTDVSMWETTRSTSDILSVIRSHSPGLRHVYNTYLRIHTGMKGKVTLCFAIAPSGQVVDADIVSSSTGAVDFDSLVVEKILSWRFEPVKAIGNDIVTVPFNFSE